MEELAARITAGHERDRDRAEKQRRELQSRRRRGRHNGVMGTFVTETVEIP